MITSSEPDVQARRRGIETDVAGNALPRERVTHTIGGVVHEAAPGEFFEEIHAPVV